MCTTCVSVARGVVLFCDARYASETRYCMSAACIDPLDVIHERYPVYVGMDDMLCKGCRTTPLPLVIYVSEYNKHLVHISIAYSGHRSEHRLHIHVRYCNSLSTIGTIGLGREYVIEISPHRDVINVALQ